MASGTMATGPKPDNQRRRGAYSGKMTPSNKEAIDTFLGALRARKFSERTIENYYYTIRHLGDVLYPVTLLDASPADLLNWQRSISGNTPGYVANQISKARSFYGWCRRPMRWIDENPADELIAPKAPRRLPRPVPEEDVERAIIMCADQRTRCWLILMRFCGLRCCEVAWLTRDSVVTDRAGARLVVTGKGRKMRPVPIPPELVALLTQWLPRDGRVFRHPDGRPVTPRYVSNVISQYFAQIGMPYTAHPLRHSFGSRSLDEIGDLRVVQELLGHSSPETTALYTEPSLAKAQQVSRTNGVKIKQLLRPHDARRVAP